MKATEKVFTWTNRHIWSKIDRALCNEECISYGHITSQLEEKHFSDTSPIHMEINTTIALKRKSFRFINILTEDEKFMEIVEHSWQQPFWGTNMFRLWIRLKLCKEPLKLLQHEGICSLDNRIAATRKRLNDIQAHLNYASHQEFIERERIAVVEMTKWMNIQLEIRMCMYTVVLIMMFY